MRLLIVDDDKKTRDGLEKEISLSMLGITEVLKAENGLCGLGLAKRYQPEIILTDICMPVMNGLTMIERIHKVTPYTSIIFMSEFSEKDFFKEAIKLNAVRFVEKPLKIEELEDAVRDAIKKKRFVQRKEYLEMIYKQESMQRLTLALARNEILKEKQKKESEEKKKRKEQTEKQIEKQIEKREIEIEKKAEESLYYNIAPIANANTYCTTMIIKFLNPIVADAAKSEVYQTFQYIGNIAENRKRQLIYAFENNTDLVIHIFNSHKKCDHTEKFLRELIKTEVSQYGDYYITCGRTVRGAANIHLSYESAQSLQQQCFFKEANSIIIESKKQKENVIIQDRIDNWNIAVKEYNMEKCIEIIHCIFAELKEAHNILPGRAKHIFYKYFIQLEANMNSNSSALPLIVLEDRSVWEGIEKCKTLIELRDLLTEYTKTYMDISQNRNNEESLIIQIKTFIRDNCSVSSLSVNDISEHVNLSVCYLCTMFKNKTGQTLNQCIIEYRMRWAKEMLRSTNFKINDISAAVGYREGNYFAKIFKKHVGISPSEYRAS